MQPSTSTKAAITETLTRHFSGRHSFSITPIGGGSINQTFLINFGRYQAFCKKNNATKFPGLFEKEKNGLEAIAANKCIRIPVVIDSFETGDDQVLLLEWITEGPRTESFWRVFGEQLARLHREATAPVFGFDQDNYMGSVPQGNGQLKDWTEFFSERRLRPLVERCKAKRLLSESHVAWFEKLYPDLGQFFEPEEPGLLHGDLWSGNFLCDADAKPVLIDPAVYFGHRSVDLAMTTLFGGFRQPFYDAYHYHYPVPSNHKEQWEVCNLYPLLIHLYLFGASYLPQIERTLNRFA